MVGMKCPWALTECTAECAIFLPERGKCSVRVVSEMIGGVYTVPPVPYEYGEGVLEEDASEIEAAEESGGSSDGSEESGQDASGEGTSGGDVQDANASVGEVRGHAGRKASKKSVHETDSAA